MKLNFKLLFLMLFLLVLPVTTFVTAQDEPATATFGIAVNEYKHLIRDLRAAQELGNDLGLQLPIKTVSMFVGFNDVPDFSQFSELVEQEIVIQLTLEATDIPLTSIISGDYDDYLWRLHDEMAEYEGDVRIRLFHEFNGDWYSWSSALNSPKVFIGAFRHVVSILDAENVTFMWCPNVLLNDEDLGEYYPGDRFVDYNGIDGFNFGSTYPEWSTWQSFSTIFEQTYQAIKRISDKPIVIAETASAEKGGDKALWVEGMKQWLIDHPDIEGVVIFNIEKEAHWQMDSSPESLEAFLNGFAVSFDLDVAAATSVQEEEAEPVAQTNTFSDFESWSIRPGNTSGVTIDTEGLHISSNLDTEVKIVSDKMPFDPARSYKLVIDIEVYGANGDLGVVVDYFDAEEAYIDNLWRGVTTAYSGPLEMDIRLPDNASAFDVVIYSKAGTSLSADIRSIQLVTE